MTARFGGLFYLKGVINMQKSLIINSTDVNGNAKAKSITNINPDASNEQLQEFAQRLTALSTNTYSGASVVTKTDVTEAVGGGVTVGKPIPTFEIIRPMFLAQGDEVYYLEVKYTGDGQLKAIVDTKLDDYRWAYIYKSEEITQFVFDDSLEEGTKFVIYALETENYAPFAYEGVLQH